MNGVDAVTGWRNLKQRLSFKGLGGCCGATWSPGSGATDEEEEAGPPSAMGGGMNLAMALARERDISGPATKSLMRLIEETDGVDLGSVGAHSHVESSDWSCCVCMERSKGAAFIPCGHAFCRACSRELWLNRGSCPVCNRSIVDVLDIF